MTRHTMRRRSPRIEALEDRALLSTIRGSLFEDLNANGLHDPGEPGLPVAGATVYLDLNGDGVLDAGEPSTATDATGSYAFTGLAAGSYTVAQVAPAGTRQTAPAPSPGPGQLGDIIKDFAPPTDHPYGLAWVGASDPNPGLYAIADDAAGKNRGQIDRIDPATGASLGAIPGTNLSAYSFYGLAYDGRNLWGTDANKNLLVQFDTAGHVIRSFTAPIASARGIAWDGQVLWISAYNSPITKVDPSSGQAMGSIPAPDTNVTALAFDGSRLWASGVSNGKVTELDPATGAVLRSYTPSGYFQTPFSGSGNDIWGLGYDGHRLWLSLRGLPGGPGRLFQVDASHPGTQTVAVDGITDVGGVDFGDFRLGSISGTVADGSGAGLAGWHVYLDNNGDGQIEAWEPWALTDSAGRYTISGLAPGSYSVTEMLRSPGWAQTAPAAPAAYAATIGSSGQAIAGEDFTDVLSGVGPIGPEALVNATTAGTQQIASVGAVATDGKGRTVVVWQGPSGAGSGVFTRVYDAGGNALTGEILVSSFASGIQLNNIMVAMNASGNFVVTWASNFSVYARTYSAAGAPQVGPITVFAATTSIRGNTYGIGIDSAGNFGVEYYTGPASFGSSKVVPSFNVQLYTAAGAARLRNPILAGTDTCTNCGGGSLAMAPDGHFVVALHNNGISAQRYSSTGSALGGVITVAANDLRIDPSIAMDPATGNFVIAWEDRVLGGHAARAFRADGTALGSTSPFLYTNVGSGWGKAFPIAIDGSGILVAYPANGNLLAQRFSADGSWTPIDARPFVVNTTFGAVPVGNAVLQASASVALTGGGNFVATWSGGGIGDDAGVFVQRYAAPAVRAMSLSVAAAPAPALADPVAITPAPRLVRLRAGRRLHHAAGRGLGKAHHGSTALALHGRGRAARHGLRNRAHAPGPLPTTLGTRRLAPPPSGTSKA